jgi:hypothetical protein
LPGEIGVASPDLFKQVVRGMRPRGFGHGTYDLAVPRQGGREYVVATDGRDGGAGTRAAPFRTINHAARVVRAGDVVTIRSGVYDETVEVVGSGTRSAPIVFQAERRGAVVLGGSRNKRFAARGWNAGLRDREGVDPGLWVTLRGLKFHQTAADENPDGTDPAAPWKAAVGASRGWRIEDCWFDDAGHDALMVRGSHVQVVRSTFENNWTHAILAGTGLGPRGGPDAGPRIEHLLFRDLLIHSNHTRTRSIDRERSTKVVKCFRTGHVEVDNVESCHNRNGPGWWFDRYNVHYHVHHCYFHHNGSESAERPTGRGLYLEVNDAGPGLVEYNVLADNESSGLDIANSANVVVRRNLFASNHRSIYLTDSERDGQPFRTRNILVEENLFYGWRAPTGAGIHSGGRFWAARSAAELRIHFDRNTYHPTVSRGLAFWAPGRTQILTSLEHLRSTLGWEAAGRLGHVEWPL